MALTTIPQKPIYIGDAPNRLNQVQSVYSANADNMMGYLADEAANQNTVTNATNTLAGEVEAIGAAAEANKNQTADDVIASANSAAAALASQQLAAVNANSVNGNPIGAYANGITFNTHNDYVSESGLFRLKASINPPYTTNTTAYPLATDDPNLAPWSDVSEIQAIARSLNVLDSQVIYATNTTTQLGTILYIHDAATQKTWAKPANVGATEVIVSVSASGVLTTDVTTYQLTNIRRLKVENVSAAKSISGLIAGDVVETAGYYTAGLGRAIYDVVSGNIGDGWIDHDVEGNTLKLRTDNGVFNSLQAGAIGDNAADDTLSLIAGLEKLTVDPGNFQIIGECIYDTNTAGGTLNLNFKSVRNPKIGGVFAKGVINMRGSGLAISVNTTSQVFGLVLDKLVISNVDNVEIPIQLAVTVGANTWGCSLVMNDTLIRGFKDTQLEILQGFNCKFSRCEIQGADGFAYGRGRFLPAVAGATSSCMRILGGNPIWTGDAGLSNLNKFDQCIFQNAKYAIDGRNVDQSVFDTCTFQYLWIPLLNYGDDVNSKFDNSKIVLQGSNYAEWISNRFMSGVPILDDGVTVGAYVYDGTFYDSGWNNFDPTRGEQGENTGIVTNQWRGVRYRTRAQAEKEWIKLVEFNAEENTQKDFFSVLHNGAVLSDAGIDCSSSFFNLTPATENTNVLSKYRQRYGGYAISGGSWTFNQTYSQQLGNVVTVTMMLGGTFTGTGNMTVALGTTAIVLGSIQLTASTNAVAAPNVIYGNLQAGTTLRVFKDVKCTMPLVLGVDLTPSFGELTVITFTFITA